ncbi:MAG: hypothetical protein OEW62_00640 [Candidatus Bathyarchaeota archaeon]|nr:hypothetical protein [Candidatus Bathyarchaeota archaeon]
MKRCSLLNLESIKEKGLNLKKLKKHIKKQLENQEIGIAEELSENLLREIFLDTKERLKNKTKYKVNEIHFPKSYLFALLVCERDWRKFLTYVFLSQSKNEREKTNQSWKEEYPEEKPTFEEKMRGVKSVTIPISSEKTDKPTFFFIGLSSKKRTSLKHELTHYFEVKLNLPVGSLGFIWK